MMEVDHHEMVVHQLKAPEGFEHWLLSSVRISLQILLEFRSGLIRSSLVISRDFHASEDIDDNLVMNSIEAENDIETPKAFWHGARSWSGPGPSPGGRSQGANKSWKRIS